VGRLPYGLQKRVELGRALAAEPEILLLDEPMAGMNVEEKQDMCRFILDVNDQFGTTIVLIEHDMGVVMDISDRVVVLDYGKKIGDGTPDEVRSNQDVINAYLGTVANESQFFFEVLIGGLLSGVMYALVAMGFVLIYKASGVFNFAQGAMVFFAALTCVGVMDNWRVAVAGHAAHDGRDDLLGLAIERVVLRPLVNQPEITLFMATIGLAFFIEGLAQLVFGAQVRKLELPIEDVPIAVPDGQLQHPRLAVRHHGGRHVRAAGHSLALLFSKTKVGRALRAWPTTTRPRWRSAFRCSASGPCVGVAGLVALVAGMLWGARNGVQFALTFVALKALPVLILGGFTSMPGAIVGGLIIGARKAGRGLYRPAGRRRHRGLVPVRAGPAVPAGAAGRPVRRKNHPI
jgi:branched-chain amino acid transport system permease protein